MNRKLLIALFIIQLIAVNGIAFYFGGIRRYGSPAQFAARRAEVAKVRADSIRSTKATVVPPENAGDSVMYDMGNHAHLFQRTQNYEAQIRSARSLADSIKRERAIVEEKEISVARREELVRAVEEQAKNKNMAGLAKMFEAMKTTEAVTVMTEINDSLAVGILSRMQSRNSAKLLGAVALADTAKAVRLSKLLAGGKTGGAK